MIELDQAEKEIGNILESKEYQVYYEDSRNILQVWWDKAKNWLVDLLNKWFSSFEPSGGLADGILIVTIIAAVGLIGLIGYKVIRNTRRNHRFHEQQPLHSMNERNWTFQTHLTEARNQEKLGQYNTAIRHLFLAVLLYFHEKEWLEARIWKTNWEYYAELRKVNQNRAEQFYNLALLFDQVAYGKREINKSEYEKYLVQTIHWLESDGITDTPAKG